MKCPHRNRSSRRSRLAAVLLIATALAGLEPRQVGAYTNSFDTPASTNGWVHWWGGARETIAFDPLMDAGGDPASGSMAVSVPFSRSLGGDNQFSMWGSFSGVPESWTTRLDGTLYTHLEMDLYWDPFSPRIPSSGNFSSDFHYGFAVGDPVYGQIDFQNHLTIPESEGGRWVHLEMPLDAATIGSNLTNIVGIWIKMWTGSDPDNSVVDGSAVFWIDNIRLRAAPPPPPPTTDYTNHFHTVEALNGWVHWWGGASETREFDATMDADGDPNSGSMKVSVPYNRSLSDNQFSMWGSFSGSPNTWTQPLNGILYTNLEMDIYWDPNSPTRPSTGDYGNDFRYGFAVGDPSYGQIAFNNHSTILPADVGHWLHLSAPIDLASVGPNITNIVGVWLKMWTGSDPNNSLTDGTTVFWVDNIRLRAKATNAPPIPAPTLGLESVSARGLRLFASAPGAQYQRQGIRTVNPTDSWVGAIDPVTYSITISDHPGVPGFQTHMFLVPGSVPNTDTSPDYSQPNVAFLDIQGNADGTAYANFRYKINEPNGNGFLYGAGTIAGVGSTTALGTWSLTFNPGGNIALTSPSGSTTNFAMPSEAVSMFSGPLYAYFGIQPNNPNNIGLAATIGRVQISGIATPIDESFTTSPINSQIWEVVAQDPTGVIPVTPDALFWLNWTVPDVGYKLQSAPGLGGPWVDLGLTVPQLGNRKRTLLYPSNLPASESGHYFFRMSK